jgi:hypothetical protein
MHDADVGARGVEGVVGERRNKIMPMKFSALPGDTRWLSDPDAASPQACNGDGAVTRAVKGRQHGGQGKFIRAIELMYSRNVSKYRALPLEISHQAGATCSDEADWET